MATAHPSRASRRSIHRRGSGTGKTARTGLTGLRVLVVEDEYLIADDIASSLAASGAEIIGPVGTQEQALQLVASKPLDLAVLDINLHGTMAFSVAAALREKNVPFVFATGYDRSVVPQPYRDVPVWEKPFQYEDLAWALPRLAAVRP